MPRSTPPPGDELPPELRDALRAGLRASDNLKTAKVPPLAPVEPLLERLRQLPSKESGEAGPLPSTLDVLALAARSGESISPATRAKIADLVRQMKRDEPSADGR